MEPSRKHTSSGVPVKEEVESEDGNDLLAKRRRTEVSEQQIEVFGMENKAPAALPVEDSTGKDPMDVLNSCAVQNSGQANGCSNESVCSRLLKICKAIGWKEPAYDFEEQGPQHSKIFKCKVTVHLDGLLNTVTECFSEAKPRKKAA
ncbi:dicer-like protein 4 [Miscanthus floridulus]|uniref:dicer-like protein 4 n=1 Tax=Miscanthus floridulus TaxID=154761 RepID=UPI003459A711